MNTAKHIKMDKSTMRFYIMTIGEDSERMDAARVITREMDEMSRETFITFSIIEKSMNMEDVRSLIRKFIAEDSISANVAGDVLRLFNKTHPYYDISELIDTYADMDREINQALKAKDAQQLHTQLVSIIGFASCYILSTHLLIPHDKKEHDLLVAQLAGSYAFIKRIRMELIKAEELAQKDAYQQALDLVGDMAEAFRAFKDLKE